MTQSVNSVMAEKTGGNRHSDRLIGLKFFSLNCAEGLFIRT